MRCIINRGFFIPLNSGKGERGLNIPLEKKGTYFFLQSIWLMNRIYLKSKDNFNSLVILNKKIFKIGHLQYVYRPVFLKFIWM